MQTSEICHNFDNTRYLQKVMLHKTALKLLIMKKICLLILLSALFPRSFAEGLLSRTSQSAQYNRMLSRNASRQADAVYFNPAGLILLEDGLYLSVHNQSLFQSKTIISGYPYLNDSSFKGKADAFLLPSVVAVYKSGNFALSLGFGNHAVAGPGTFDQGLPSFEIPVSSMVPFLSFLNDFPSPYKADITGYDAQIRFEGSSVAWGIQAGATYRANEYISGYAGVRYLPSTHKFSGSIHDILLKVNGSMAPAASWLTGTALPALTGLSSNLNATSGQLTASANSVQQIITGGLGNYTLQQVQTAGYITSAQKAQYEAALGVLGYSSAQIAAMNMNQIKTNYSNGATKYKNDANVAAAAAQTVGITGSALEDMDVETVQTGAGWTPMAGLQIMPVESLNLTVRYEMKTKREMTWSTDKDDVGLFPDGTKVNSDIPALLALGVGYKPSGKIEAQLSYNLFFDKNLEWGMNFRDQAVFRSPADQQKIRERRILNNTWDLAAGLQFEASGDISLSFGGMIAKSGAGESYQSDFSFHNPSYSAAMGIQWKLSEKLTLDAGAMNTFYREANAKFNDNFTTPYEDAFRMKGFGFAAGLTFLIE